MNTNVRLRNYKIRIRSKGRFCLFITLFILLLVILASLIFPIWTKGLAMNYTTYLTVYVEEGDTLWHIASKTLPKRTDIRDYIHEIYRLNNLETANLRIGQKLIIPIH